MWSDNKENAKNFIKSLLSDAAKAAAKARTASSNAAFDKAFAAAKILGKTSPNRQLHAGDKAKDNPKDMISWLAASRLWLLLQGVPLHLLFAIAVFCCLSADARAMVFPQLKDFSEPEQLMDGSYTWEDFSSRVWVPFDQQTARAAARQSSNGGGGNGFNSRDRRSQQRGFPPRQPFKPAGGVQKPQHGKGKFQPKPKFTGKREPVTCYGCGEQREHQAQLPQGGTAEVMSWQRWMR
ncbi:hypothetical protein OEZ85_004783 [Tetradesmus obliquus]|uniref:CCHC-type domain-containing protein n=1 Tax=Tetradesmus obliquus TaxID=3088 RepID=A0ABY8UQB8_TETOB|nr:hypothetical protein OEZ85_004783 [Tetradesmus obliquus]